MRTYANKETRDRLREKSLLCYGRAGRYKKVMNENGITIEEIEKVLDQMIAILKGGKDD